MSERIDHAAEARELLAANVEGDDYAEVISNLHMKMTGAQVHATLALVEQQRIANVLTLQSGSVNATTDPAQDLVFEPDSAGDPVLRSEIREALWLRE